MSYPGLTRYRFYDEELKCFSSQFVCVSKSAWLIYWDSDRGNLWPTQCPSTAGIYFWLLDLPDGKYKIYAGKTRSLKRRVKDYLNGFQPHSPNDFKLQIFQRMIADEFPDSIFELYFRETEESRLAALENHFVKEYGPLLNERNRASDSAKALLKEAYDAFFRNGIEERIK